MSAFQAHGPRCGVLVLCPSALVQCSQSIRGQRGEAQLQVSCIWMEAGGGGRGRWKRGWGWDFVAFTQASCTIRGANEPCLGASQLLLQKGTEVLHHLSALFRRLRYPPKSKKIRGDNVSATVSGPECVRCFLEFESQFTCSCVHRAMRNEQFAVHALEFRQCLYCIFSCANANLLHIHTLTGPVKAST